MITVSVRNRGDALINPLHVVSVTEAGQSSQWHGTRSILRTVDGETFELSDDLSQLKKSMSLWFETHNRSLNEGAT